MYSNFVRKRQTGKSSVSISADSECSQMHCCNGVLKKRVKRVQPLVEVFNKNTLEIINALLIDERPLSRLSTASTCFLRDACFNHWLKHMWGSRYTGGVIRGCHTDFFAERFTLNYFFWGGGGGGCPSLVFIIVYVLW